MAKYRVAVEHIHTHQIWRFDVEADAMSTAAGRGLQAADRETDHEHYLFEVVSVWRLDIPFKKRSTRRKR